MDTYTIRTKTQVIAKDLTADQIIDRYTNGIPAGHAVVLPNKRGKMPLSVFIMWVRSTRARQTANA
jgi:hypothetical protein